MAASLLTFHRDNVIQDTRYGLVTSWEALMAEAAAEIDQTMALTAWEKALRESYITQHVYRLMFLVLDSRAFREKLLIDERPRVARPQVLVGRRAEDPHRDGGVGLHHHVRHGGAEAAGRRAFLRRHAGRVAS